MEENSNKRVKEDEEDKNSCPICFEAWTSQGSHQLCSLACGHFFGKSCIERVLTEMGRAARKCSICNRPAKPSEIRLHFVISSLATKDNYREDALQQELQQERAMRISAERSDGRNKARIEALENELAKQRASPLSSQIEVDEHNTNSSSTRINIPIGRSRSCCWISCERGAVVAMQCDSKYRLCNVHPDFPTRTQTPSAGTYPLLIKDICYSAANAVSYGGALATASMDGTVRLVSAQNLNELCAFKLNEPVWSVCFQSDRILLAGVKSKLVSLDPRMPREPVNTIDLQFGSMEPIHSICALSDTSALVASFTSLAVVEQCTRVSPISGLSARAKGAQYMSIATHDSCLAVSVTGKADEVSFVEVGKMDQSTFTLERKLEMPHRAVGGARIAFNGRQVLVPTPQACMQFPLTTMGEGKPVHAATKTNMSAAWFCHDAPSLAMLLGTDIVEFFSI